MVTFATQNAIMDPPFTRLDVLVCRNLLIYLGPELQKRLLPLFHYSLNPGGVLFLGSAETTGAQPGSSRPSPASSASIDGARPRARSTPSPFPAVLRARRRSRQQPRCGAEAGPRPPVARGPGPAAAVRSGRRPRERGGRHPLRQRTDGKVPRAGRRQGELEHLRHGARRAARELPGRVPQGCRERGAVAAARRPVGTGGTAARSTSPSRRVRARGAPRDRADRLLRRAPRPGAEAPAPQGTAAPRPAAAALQRSTRAREALRQPPRETQAIARGDADLPGGAQVRQRGAPVHQRGAPVDQRGADDLQGGDAVAERGAPDRQRRGRPPGWTS